MKGRNLYRELMPRILILLFGVACSFCLELVSLGSLLLSIQECRIVKCWLMLHFCIFPVPISVAVGVLFLGRDSRVFYMAIIRLILILILCAIIIEYACHLPIVASIGFGGNRGRLEYSAKARYAIIS